MAGLSAMIENHKPKSRSPSDDKTVGTLDSLSKRDLALIRPTSRRGGKRNGSSSKGMDLSQVLESMNESAASMGSSNLRDSDPDNRTIDSREITHGAGRRTTKRGGRRVRSKAAGADDAAQEQGESSPRMQRRTRTVSPSDD